MKLSGTTIFFSFLFATFSVIGVVLLWQGVQSATILNEARSWPTTKGTITSCKFEDLVNKKGEVSGELTIKYTYRVNGKAYENDKLSFDHGGLHSYKAQKSVYKKLKGVKQIGVYYNPTDPQLSALSCSTTGDVYGSLAIAMTSLSFAFGIALLAWPDSKMDKALLKNLKTYE